MSRVSLSGNALGTGTFTIASPNSNTDRTLTLPDQTGTLLTGSGALNINASAPTSSLTLDASGNLGVGTTSKLSGGIGGIDINRSSGAGLTLGTSGTSRGFFYVNSANNSILWETVSGVSALVVSGGSGGVSLANGATSWAAISDERLKTSVTPFEGALQKVVTLRAGTGRYLSDAESVSRSFLVAQDVQAVLPEAVDVQNDEQGTLALRYTDTIPLLVAAIQELKADLDATKAELAELKGQA